MANPVLVEVTRGHRVESIHRGSVAVVDAAGKLVFSCGDIEVPVFPRSAVKAIQALPLMESGAADRFKLTGAEIALAVSSHSGEALHASTAAGMLAKAGRDVGCLDCGAHWPMGEAATRDLARSGQSPTPLHNNCSGKHSGFICLACALDEDPQGYVTPAHRVQREVKRALEEMTQFKLDDDLAGVDGCSIPTYAIPLQNMAQAFAKIATGHGLGPERAKAFARIRQAAAENPFMVAGTGRFDTDVMAHLGARAFTKTGAEGVYCAALPEQGLGIALKCDDGAGRAAQGAMGALLARHLGLDEDARAKLIAVQSLTLRNWNGIELGEIRPCL